MNEEVRMTTNMEAREPFLFKPASWQSKIDFIHHLTQYNNVLTVVLAERQGGKSSFGQLIQQSIDSSSMKISLIDIEGEFEPEMVNNRIAEEFDLTESGSIASLMKQVNEQRKPVFLMIDNAQYVNELWLSALLNAMQTHGDTNFFHVCMLADYTIVSMLNQVISDKFQNLVHSIELGGLKENECRTYILHQARQLGLANDYINDSMFKRIYKATAGDIAQINQNLNQLLAQRTPDNSSYSSLKIGAVAAGLALFAAGMTYLMQPTLRIIDKKQAMKTSKKQWAANENRRLHAPLVSKKIENPSLTSYIPGYRLAAVVSKTSPMHRQAISTKVADATVNMESSLPNLKQLAVIEKLTPPTPLKVETAQLTSYLPPLKIASVKDEVEHYTIQLLASISKQDLKEFAGKEGFDKSAKIQKIQKEGKDWYILTLGDFTGFSKAKKELNELPASVAAHKPWIRPVKTA